MKGERKIQDNAWEMHGCVLIFKNALWASFLANLGLMTLGVMVYPSVGAKGSRREKFNLTGQDPEFFWTLWPGVVLQVSMA